MQIAFFDTHQYDRAAFTAASVDYAHRLTFFEARLDQQTASLAAGFDAVCAFVSDRLDRATLGLIKAGGTRLIALRSAGFNNVDLAAAAELDLPVVRVPEYSPHAVAEHALALVLALNRKLHRAHARVREGNFSLDGLVGFDLCGKTVGIVGAGKIGRVAARIFAGCGCRVLAFDLARTPGLDVTWVELLELYREADVISMHVPLTPSTRHMIDSGALAQMKRGVMLINTSRGALIDSPALVGALKTGQIGAAGLDVYEEEEGIFFENLSEQVLQDDVLARLMTFPNVLITAHQGFLTHEALHNIAHTTLGNVTAFERGEPLKNQVKAEQ